MGVKGIDTTEIVFDNVKVGPRQVIGGGFLLAMQSLNAMRPIVAARGIGLAEGALMYADAVREGARRLRQEDRRLPGNSMGDRETRHRD